MAHGKGDVTTSTRGITRTTTSSPHGAFPASPTIESASSRSRGDGSDHGDTIVAFPTTPSHPSSSHDRVSPHASDSATRDKMGEAVMASVRGASTTAISMASHVDTSTATVAGSNGRNTRTVRGRIGSRAITDGEDTLTGTITYIGISGSVSTTHGIDVISSAPSARNPSTRDP